MADPRASNQPQTPEDKLQQLGRAIYQYEQIIKSKTPGTPEFNRADSALKKLREQFDTANEEVQTKRDAAKQTTRDKKLKALEEERLRKIALDQDTSSIDEEITTVKTKFGTTPFVTTPRDTTKVAGPVLPPPKSGDSSKDKDKDKEDEIIKKDKEKTAAELEAEALDTAASKDFSLPETLFKNIPSLNTLLKRYVAEKWNPEKLRKAIREDVWFRQNSEEIRKRYVQYYNYQDLKASGQTDGSTDYELQINKIEESLKKRAVVIGSAAGSDPIALRKAAENLYITNRSEDTSFVDDFLAASIRKVSGMIGGKVTEGYSGDALDNYKLLVTAARDNGFQVSDIIPGGSSEQQVLQGIASGTIDVNRVVADTRKLASQGQPQYVRDLLAQGYSLKQVFAPYRTIMANVLEIGAADQIDLNDPLLRSAINDKGDMNASDFKKALRADKRWQYTDQAREDVSTAALGVLRDFGFQG